VSINIEITGLGAVAADFAQRHDPTLYDRDELLLVATFHNHGDHATGQFKVMMLLDGANVHEEWIHLEPNGQHDVSVSQNLAAGGHQLEAWADLTDHVQESNEADNHAQAEIVVYEGTDKDEAVDEPDTVIVSNVGEADWKKAGFHKVTVHVQVWDFLNEPLRDYDVYLHVEGGAQDWLTPREQMDEGTAAFTEVWLHPSSNLHIGCHSRDPAVRWPYLTGIFTADVNANEAVVLHAWQDTEIETWTDSDLQAHATQWNASGTVSVKAGFKVLGVGAEVAASGTYGRGGGDTSTTGTARTHRVLVAKDNLLAQQPQRPM
jgi:hypothetical protein